MDADREERLRRRARWLRITAIAGPALAILAQFLTHPVMRESVPVSEFVLMLFMPAALTIGIAALIAARRTRRRIEESRQGERWPLGEPYGLAFQHKGRGNRSHGELHVGPDDLTLLVQFGDPVSVPLTDVATIRVRASAIDVETPRAVLMLFPGSYADRQRLLWELAVRCPDAMERGIDESAATARPAPPAAAPLASDDPPRGPSGLALGSALAGPMERGNRAPPRKSGLGVGLFVPPPGPRSTDET
jgi:hypothetical protein